MSGAVLKFDHPTGHEVWRWPEFQAFAKRLGIEPSLPTVDLIIEIPLDDIVTVAQTYLADENRQASKDWPAIETTTVHNEQFKTFRPLPNDRPVAEAGLHGMPFERETPGGGD